MKKKILALACLILIGGLSAFFFGACDKDTNCYVEVTVIDEITLNACTCISCIICFVGLH